MRINEEHPFLNSAVGTPYLGGPVAPDERIASIDVLRGVAVLGILAVNIQSFSMVEAALGNPHAYGDMSGLNYWVWYLTHLLFELKFITLFSLLFGAGIVLMTRRWDERGSSPRPAFFRRMSALFAIGLVHAYLLWYGDILVTYAICGCVAYCFRKFPPAGLAVLGALLILLGAALFLSSGVLIEFGIGLGVPTEELTATPAAIQRELAAYRSGWLDQMSHRALAAFTYEAAGVFFLGPRILGVMLIGIALLRWGVLNANRSWKFYASSVALAVVVGLPAIAYGIQLSEESGWDLFRSKFLASQFNYWASLLVALGWLGLVMLACKRFPGYLLEPFAATGRMALTNYLLQTLICTTLFYGHGFGLFGSVSRVGQAGIVLAIWAVQLTLSTLWLRHARFGPLEWLWRTLTYGRLDSPPR